MKNKAMKADPCLKRLLDSPANLSLVVIMPGNVLKTMNEINDRAAELFRPNHETSEQATARLSRVTWWKRVLATGRVAVVDDKVESLFEGIP